MARYKLLPTYASCGVDEWCSDNWSRPGEAESEDVPLSPVYSRNLWKTASASREVALRVGSGSRRPTAIAMARFDSDTRRRKTEEDDVALRRASTLRAVENYRRVLADTESPFVISPLCRPVVIWNTMLVGLVVTSALIAPFEASFIGVHDRSSSPFLFGDLLGDLFFIADMALQFFLAVLDPATETFIFSHRRVIVSYLQSPQLYMDIISVLPVGRLLMMAHAPMVVVRGALFLKLLRLCRVPRLLLTWRFRRGFSYTQITLLKSLMMMALVAHTMACSWGLFGHYGGLDGQSSTTWLDLPQKPIHGEVALYRDLDAMCLYIACLYWAVFTLTGIGYGDIVPRTMEERVVGIIAMLAGALTWAIIVANLVSIVGIWSAVETQHAVRMDELEELMGERGFSPSLRTELREYFQKMFFHLDKFGRVHDMIARMSPKLASQAVEAMHAEHFQRVPWLRGLSETSGGIHVRFLVALSLRMGSKLFCPGEFVTEPKTLIMVLQGTAILGGSHVMIRGRVWGDDMILDFAPFRRSCSAVALTFLEVAVLPRSELEDVLVDFPIAQKHVRKHRVWWAVKRGIVHEAVKLKHEREVASSKTEEIRPLPRTSHYQDRRMNKAKVTRAGSNILSALKFHSNGSLSDATSNYAGNHSPVQHTELAPSRAAADEGLTAHSVVSGPVSESLEGRVAIVESKVDDLHKIAVEINTKLDLLLPPVPTTLSSQPGRSRPVQFQYANSREIPG